jgi:ubiquitin C-terminal hydrolase
VYLFKAVQHMRDEEKNNISIEYPVTGLDLSKYSIGYNSHKYVYDLYAVCNHVGGMSYGHYYVYIKNPKISGFCLTTTLFLL